MQVQNRKCIRHLSLKTLMAAKRRNAIAVMAIALTTLLFTALFTIVMSMNASYQTFQFRQLGGYCHGAFKEVDEAQIEQIAAHPKIRAVGERTIIGLCDTAPFAKDMAEVSYMDANCAKWSYATPIEGRLPETGREVAMDTRALWMLGVPAELGTQITLSYKLYGEDLSLQEITDTFLLVGYWEYDALMPVHYINISKDYAGEMQQQALSAGLGTFRTDLNVMLPSSIDIEGQMERVKKDLDLEDVRIGISWAYTASNLTVDMETVISLLAFVLLVIFTGYLVIYNIFQISVAGDIRFYGLLKTIGVTPGQLQRIIRNQALMLCVPGIPLGLLGGFAVGAVVFPIVLESSNLENSVSTLSYSPVIFVGASFFALITVLISCRRPGRMAAKISPVEASKYTDVSKKGSRKKRHTGILGMAVANLGRNRKKTGIVMISLSLALVLLNLMFAFVNGFDMEEYLSSMTCCDFVVSSTDFFHTNHVGEYITEEMITEIAQHVNPTFSGCGYTPQGYQEAFMKESAWRKDAAVYGLGQDPDARIEIMEKRDGLIKENVMIEGMDSELLEKMVVLAGSVEPLKDTNSNQIALDVSVDDNNQILDPEDYPAIGETLTVVYIDSYGVRDIRTGEDADENTPWEYCESYGKKSHEVDYTVCAYISVPYAISQRYYMWGYRTIMGVETLRRDSGQQVVPLFYAFDTADETKESAAEAYLSELTAGDMSSLMYESKETARAEFEQFRNMFLIVGGVLCAVIAMVGILNFFNAIMTGIMARSREFAVLQAIGMTGWQLKQMLITEGLLYAVGSGLLALLLSLVMNPLVGGLLEELFWFCVPRFTILPVLVAIPVFALIGWLVPDLLYSRMRKNSIVERLREIDL